MQLALLDLHLYLPSQRLLGGSKSSFTIQFSLTFHLFAPFATQLSSSSSSEFKMRKTFGQLFLASLVAQLGTVEATCKAVPGSPGWPSAADWTKLNHTLHGALIQTTVDSLPGAPCHPELDVYNNGTCAIIQQLWYSWGFHENSPVDNAAPNWNNDSCLPYAQFPCTTEGYPSYVVNATTHHQVQAAINFARKNNIRTNVKTSGHDFLGRSVAPNSLSIWLTNMHGLKVHKNFKPNCKSCGHVGPAITFSAGDTHGIVYAAANASGLMVPVAGAPTVSYGGYVTGGGHSAMGATYGLAADLVQEITVVTPDGKVVTANKGRNSDLFWALRGGGGATFGVIVSMTIQAFPATPVGIVVWGFLVNPGSSHFYDIAAYFTTQLPSLLDSGLMGYAQVSPGNSTSPGTIGAEVIGFSKNTWEIETILAPATTYINNTWPGETTIYFYNPANYSSFYEYWSANPDTSTPVGVNVVIGSRLLDKPSLANKNLSSLLEEAGPNLSYIMVGGPGVRNKSQDLNAVCPGWRTSYLHAST